MKVLNKLCSILLFASLLAVANVYAQKPDADLLLKQATNETNITKDYQKAIKIAKSALVISPEYADLHLLLGRLYFITADYDKARQQFLWVIGKNPSQLNALNYLVNLENENKNWEKAITYIDQAIKYSDSQDLIIKKASLLESDKQYKEAYLLVKDHTSRYPENMQAQLLLINLYALSRQNKIGISYNYTSFSHSHINPWNFGSVFYTREETKASFIAKMNFVDRGVPGNRGYQFEAEAYPKHHNGYSFINFAYSNTLVFPKFRFGYSFYKNFKRGWEAETGARYVHAGETSLISYGGSVGKYFNSYWLNFRPFLTSDKGDLFPSAALTARKYLSHRDSYLTIILGAGSSPDERIKDFGSRYNLSSYRASLGFQHLLGKTTIIGALSTMNNQEFIPGKRRNEFDIFVNLQQKF